jgi:hypothetical protein
MSLGSLNAQQISFVAILIVAFGLLTTERIRSDVVAILIILRCILHGSYSDFHSHGETIR